MLKPLLVASLLLLPACPLFAQGSGASAITGPFTLPTNAPTDGTPFTIAPVGDTPALRACAYKWDARDKKSCIVLVMILRQTKDGQKREMIVQTMETTSTSDPAKGKRSATETLRLVDDWEISEVKDYLVEALKSFPDNPKWDWTTYGRLERLPEGGGGSEHGSMNINARKDGKSSVSFYFSFDDEHFSFDFSPKEQLSDVIAKYERLRKWTGKP